jgi:hypothetical protein
MTACVDTLAEAGLSLEFSSNLRLCSTARAVPNATPLPVSWSLLGVAGATLEVPPRYVSGDEVEVEGQTSARVDGSGTGLISWPLLTLGGDTLAIPDGSGQGLMSWSRLVAGSNLLEVPPSYPSVAQTCGGLSSAIDAIPPWTPWSAEASVGNLIDSIPNDLEGLRAEGRVLSLMDGAGETVEEFLAESTLAALMDAVVETCVAFEGESVVGALVWAFDAQAALGTLYLMNETTLAVSTHEATPTHVVAHGGVLYGSSGENLVSFDGDQLIPTVQTGKLQFGQKAKLRKVTLGVDAGASTVVHSLDGTDFPQTSRTTTDLDVEHPTNRAYEGRFHQLTVTFTGELSYIDLSVLSIRRERGQNDG